MKTLESRKDYFNYSTQEEDKYTPIEKRTRAFANIHPFYRFLHILSGFSRKEPHADYLYNFVLGFVELAAYSYLMQVGAFQYIGGWLTLKIVAQWNAWKSSRHAIVRYFILTALQLIFCYAFLAKCPSLTPPKDGCQEKSACK